MHFFKGSFSCQSSVCNEDLEEEDIKVETESLTPWVDISTWSPQQVADYFSSKGFKDESESMLEHVGSICTTQ